MLLKPVFIVSRSHILQVNVTLMGNYRKLKIPKFLQAYFVSVYNHFQYNKPSPLSSLLNNL